MRKYILLGLLVLTAAFALGPQINTNARCSSGVDCNIGDGKPSGITLDTDGADANIDGTTANTLTLTATTTNTATFTGADAAGAANTTYTTTGAGTTTLDTGGASAIVIGSADVTDVTVNSNTGITFADGGDSINNTADDIFDFTRDDAGTVTITASDNDATAALTIAAGGAAALTLGDSGDTSISMITDGGTVTVDGYVQAIKGPIISLASGALTVNNIHIGTAAADYDLPDSCDSATGNWVTLIAQDASEVLSLTVSAAEDTIVLGTAAMDADDEVDSPGGANGAGTSITVACLATNLWYVLAEHGTWVDGGAAD